MTNLFSYSISPFPANFLGVLSFIIFILIHPSGKSYGETYYFSTIDGEDSRTSMEARNPDTPWRSLEKLNAIFNSLGAGDTVLFKRGEVFYGHMKLKSSGLPKRPLLIGAYGEGDLPIITGWTRLSKWESVGEGLYVHDDVDFDAKIHLLSIDDQIMELGRFPNRDYLGYEPGKNKNEIISKDEIQNATWIGGTIALRKNEWIIDKGKIKSSKGMAFTMDDNSNYKPNTGYGFFIQEHLQTLDTHGEWFHDRDNGKIYLYLDTAPSNTLIYGANQKNLIINSPNVSNIIIQDLCLLGANESSIHLENAHNITLQNCNVSYAGENSLTAMRVSKLSIIGNYFSDALNNGLYLRYGTPDAIIENNIVKNIHLYHGMGKNGDHSGVGIFCRSDRGLIKNNQILNIGYSAINFGGNEISVVENFIDNFCLVKNDGAGIYTYEGKSNAELYNREIRKNIVLNGVGSREGNRYKSLISYPQVEGIYIDDNASGIIISENTLGNLSRNGINIHNARRIKIQDNLLFNAANLISLSDDQLGDHLDNIIIHNNLLCAINDTQKAVRISTQFDNGKKLASFSNNKYIFPHSEHFIFVFNDRSSNGKNQEDHLSFKEWNTFLEGSEGEIFCPTPILNPEITGKSGGLIKVPEIHKAVNCLNENCEIKYQESGGQHNIIVNIKSRDSGVRINIGSIKLNNVYSVKFNGAVTQPIKAYAYLRHQGHPWERLSEVKTFLLEKSKTEINFSFHKIEPAENVVLIIKTNEPTVNFLMEDIQWQAIKTFMDKTKHQLLYNSTNEIKEIHLNETFFDINQKPISNKVLIQPHSATLLFRRD